MARDVRPLVKNLTYSHLNCNICHGQYTQYQLQVLCIAKKEF